MSVIQGSKICRFGNILRTHNYLPFLSFAKVPVASGWPLCMITTGCLQNITYYIN